MASRALTARRIGGMPSALVAALIALALLVLGVVFFVVLGGEEADVEAPPAPRQRAPSPPLPTLAPTEGRGRVETFEVFAAKDPFKPLVSEGSGGAAATTQGGGGGAAAPASERPVTSGGGGAPAGGGGGAGGGARRGERSIDGRRVRLVNVFTRKGARRVRVRVDDTVYTVEPGERFAENFKLLSASGRCATLLFGDDQFTLCEGEEVLK